MMLNIKQSDEKWFNRWRFIIMMKIYHSDEIYHWMVWGLLINPINFALLTLAVLGHLDTFPDGWLGREKIKIKDKVSLAGTEVEAKLGKNTEDW